MNFKAISTGVYLQSSIYIVVALDTLFSRHIGSSRRIAYYDFTLQVFSFWFHLFLSKCIICLSSVLQHFSLCRNSGMMREKALEEKRGSLRLFRHIPESIPLLSWVVMAWRRYSDWQPCDRHLTRQTYFLLLFFNCSALACCIQQASNHFSFWRKREEDELLGLTICVPVTCGLSLLSFHALRLPVVWVLHKEARAGPLKTSCLLLSTFLINERHDPLQVI